MTRDELIKRRGEDLLALILELGSDPPIRGFFEPVGLPDPRHLVSARELAWVTTSGTDARVVARTRQTGRIPYPTAVVTAPFTFEKLNASYTPRYFLVEPIDRARSAICVAYVAGQSGLVPASHFASAHNVDPIDRAP
jgi:hypothetical protein